MLLIPSLRTDEAISWIKNLSYMKFNESHYSAQEINNTIFKTIFNTHDSRE